MAPEYVLKIATHEEAVEIAKSALPKDLLEIVYDKITLELPPYMQFEQQELIPDGVFKILAEKIITKATSIVFEAIFKREK